MRPVFWEPPGTLTPEMMRQVLGLVLPGPLPALDVIRQWTRYEMMIVYDWAIREHAATSDNPVQRRPQPWLVTIAVDFARAEELLAGQIRGAGISVIAPDLPDVRTFNE